VQAAAEACPDPKKALPVDYRELIGRLPRAECNDFLPSLAEGDASVGLALRKRLGAFLPQERPRLARQRTIQQLLQRAEQLEKAEQKRQVKAARQKHIAEMKALAAREAQTWQQVDTLLENSRKIVSVYDEATAMLEKLKQVSEYQDTRDVFQVRLQKLAQKYSSRPSLIDPWKKRGWV
jgi:hypothetical protein